MKTSRRSVLLAVLTLWACAEPATEEPPPSAPPDPSAAAAELLAADRARAAAAGTADAVDAWTGAFADDVTVPVPGEGFVRGIDAARAVLERDSLARASRVSWTPVRAGVSADGLHGFTFGYTTLVRPDSTTEPGKYLAYWVKGAAGWRMAAWRRGRSPEGVPEPAMMEPSLPLAGVLPVRDSASLAAHAAGLAAAEGAFSDEAQLVGLGPAFAKWGAADAVNMGGPSSSAWVVGAEAIAAAVGGGAPPGEPSPVSWGAERVIVAASGDLGITFGFIRANGDESGAPGYPFFTIWRKSGPDAPWRYVAE